MDSTAERLHEVEAAKDAIQASATERVEENRRLKLQLADTQRKLAARESSFHAVAMWLAQRARYDITKNVLRQVAAERVRQFQKFGEQNPPDGTSPERIAIADAARDACDQAFTDGAGTWRHILAEEVEEAFAESDPAKLRRELVEVAAVAIAWVEAIDRKKDRP